MEMAASEDVIILIGSLIDFHLRGCLLHCYNIKAHGWQREFNSFLVQ